MFLDFENHRATGVKNKVHVPNNKKPKGGVPNNRNFFDAQKEAILMEEVARLELKELKLKKDLKNQIKLKR